MQQFAALIFQIQGSERAPSPPPRPAPAPAPAPAPPVQNSQSAPPASGTNPAPPATPATPPAPQQNNNDPNSSFFRFFIHHVRTDPQARLCQLWCSFLRYTVILIVVEHVGVFMFIFLSITVRVILSPTLSMFFVAVTYSWIWLPQIWRSARRGRTSGLSIPYVIGTTACRLAAALCTFNWASVLWMRANCGFRFFGGPVQRTRCRTTR